MSTPFEEMAGLDRLIHEPARMAILTALSTAPRADFLFLQRITGLTPGNLSRHVSKLEEGGLVQTAKGYVDKRPNTMIELTPAGKQAIEAYWKQIASLPERIREWDRNEK